ncbi:MAG: transferrin-binding protein-like solute binding protein [Pseudomonadota bacterium]
MTPTTPPPGSPTNESIANLTVDELFAAAMSAISFNVDTGSGAPSNVSTTSVGFSSPASILYNAAADSFTVTFASGGVNFEETFASGDRVSADGAAFQQFVSNGSELLFIDPATIVAIERDSGGAIISQSTLVYSAFGAWASSGAASADATLGYWAFGVETETMPTTGTAQYEGLAIGALTTADAVYDISGGFGITADFSTGDIGVGAVFLRENALGGSAPEQWLEMVGTGSITSGVSFSGTTSVETDTSYSGAFEGQFYGPAAAEAAGTWSLGNTTETAVGSFGSAKLGN